MGEQALKNIARPVRTYCVALATRSASVRPNSSPPPAEKPSIAVLPFANNQKGTGMVLAFGDHQLDIKRRELRRGTELIDLEPKVFDLLAFLVQNRDRVVSKDDLLQGVWGGRIVSESALTTRINAVRRALGDDGTAQRLVRTFTRKGVRFVGEVTEMSDPAVLAVTRATSIAPPLVAPRMSIVVLPFANLTTDPEHQYFADGITEDVTTDLSRIQNSFVISRNTAFTYRNKLVDTKQIGRELGVRYVLEGSVRRSGNKVRVNAQLIDAETDAHLWAEQFDGEITDLFALQNEITSRIAIALNVELSRREAASPTNNPDALDYILRGRAAYWKTGLQSRDLFAETLWLYEQALALDPRSVEAQS
jgi:TolB-like protein